VTDWFVAQDVEIDDLLVALEDTRLQWLYAERMENTVLTALSAAREDSNEILSGSHGRAFGPQAEVAWWRAEGTFQVRVCITEGSPPSGMSLRPYDAAEDWEPVSSTGQPALLLGDRSEEETAWSVARIPRYLHYPVQEAWERVALVTQRYHHRGKVVAQRLVGFEEG
jgi:hypothetical protein